MPAATDDPSLSAEERDIAKRLAAYHRKIVSLRQPVLPEAITEGLETPRGGNKARRPSRMRSAAEDYRHARQIQRLLQGVCSSQLILTTTLAFLSHFPVLFAFLPGDLFGLAASLARVQRAHALCTVFNLAYLLTSAGMPLLLLVARVHAGGNLELARNIERSHGQQPAAVVVTGVLTGIVSILGAILGAYVLARPLHLYRYETVALDEEMAEKQTGKAAKQARKRDGALPLEVGSFGMDEEMGGGGGGQLEPIDAWLVAGEIGVAPAPKVKPLVYMPVVIKPKPKPTPTKEEGASPMPTIAPPPPSRSASAATPAAVTPAADGDSSSSKQPAWSSPEATAAALAPAVADAAADESGEKKSWGITLDGEAQEGGGEEEWGGAGDEAVEEEEEEGGEEGGEGGEGAGPSDISLPGGGEAASSSAAGGGAAWKERLRAYAADATKMVAEHVMASQSAEELFARAKALNKEGKYKKACELIEEAYAIQPKISTALSAANLRLKLGDHEKAIAAYRGVLSLVGTENGPTEREHEMANRKLAEAEERKRQSAINVTPLVRTGEPKPPQWYAAQLDELSEDLFSESATLYAEHGVALQDGLKEISRHLRATRLLACGQVLRPVEKLITRACLSPRDEGEREWLTTVRSLLNELRDITGEVGEALKEFAEQGTLGWKSAGESMGVTTEWRHDEDGSLWVRMEGELTGAYLMHAASVAHEADLWPKWVPFCSAAEMLKKLSATDLVTYIQFDLTSMMKRGAILHWTLSDSIAERQSLLLLGCSLSDETSPFGKPANAQATTLADFRAIKVLITPRTREACRIQWVTNVDLKVSNMPQALVSMVTKKIAGSIVSLLVREAQKVSSIEAEAEASNASPVTDNSYLNRVGAGGAFYKHVEGVLNKHFELFGEEEVTE